MTRNGDDGIPSNAVCTQMSDQSIISPLSFSLPLEAIILLTNRHDSNTSSGMANTYNQRLYARRLLLPILRNDTLLVLDVGALLVPPRPDMPSQRLR